MEGLKKGFRKWIICPCSSNGQIFFYSQEKCTFTREENFEIILNHPVNGALDSLTSSRPEK